MNAQEALDKLKEDRPIVEPFVNLCLQRAREKSGNQDIRLSDIEITITVTTLNATAKIYRTLKEMTEEGVAF